MALAGQQCCCRHCGCQGAAVQTRWQIKVLALLQFHTKLLVKNGETPTRVVLNFKLKLTWKLYEGSSVPPHRWLQTLGCCGGRCWSYTAARRRSWSSPVDARRMKPAGRTKKYSNTATINWNASTLVAQWSKHLVSMHKIICLSLVIVQFVWFLETLVHAWYIPVYEWIDMHALVQTKSVCCIIGYT